MNEIQTWKSSDVDYDYSSSSGYSHNTYHGPTRHYRPALTGSQLMALQFEEQKPLRFTDSPQHHSNVTPNLSPRRKSSSTSNDGSELYTPYDRGTIYIPGDYHGCQNEPTHCLGCCIRSDNNYRTETNLGFTYGPPPETNYITYESEYSGYGYATDYAYDNPSSISSHSQSLSGSRTPQRLPLHSHKRTPSNVSNASSTTTSGSNINPSFRLEDDVIYTPTHYTKRQQAIDYEYTRQNSNDSTNLERPVTLETISNYTKLRSSLKRNNFQSSQCGGGHSGGNTPTNPTPPDSLTSDDSSYVSAKDSNSSVGRVRFSPTLLDLNAPGQHQDSTIPLQARRMKRPSLVDVERDFLS